jgi:hypothetical protein
MIISAIPDLFTRRRCDDVAPLIEGHYLIVRPMSRRVDIPVKVWFGQPIDPEGNGQDTLDRSPRWQIKVGFDLVGDDEFRVGGMRFRQLEDIWPACARYPIEQEDYEFRIQRAAWAIENDPNDAMGRFGGKIDPMTCTLP